MLREDNLGLGAKIGGNKDTFGLSMFSGLLGRLNGKDDGTLQKQEDARRDVELRLYHASKHGTMNFVSGGLLVGDKMEEPKSTKIEDIKPQVFAVKEVTKTSKKRKASEDDAGENAEDTLSKKRLKSEKKSMKDSTKEESERSDKKRKQKPESVSAGESLASSDSDSSDGEDVTEKESRKSRKSEKSTKSTSEINNKARLKEEKRARKEERRKRREEKRRRKEEKAAKISSSKPSTVTSEAENSGTSTPTFMGGRQAVRHRYIMQKRMASQSAQALKEIFMLQPQPAT